jgi:DNA-binding PucR family transcriptional regulator
LRIDDWEAFRRIEASHSRRRHYSMRERLTELTRLEGLTEDPEALIASQGDAVIVLFDPGKTDAASRKAAALALARRILTRVPERLSGLTVTIGIGRDFPTVDQLPESYRQAMTAALLGSRRLGGNLVLHFDDLGIHRILHVLEQSEEPLPDGLTRLIAYDQRRKSSLLQTLRVYLDVMGRGSIAAERLFLHRNSLEYRIKRIEQILDGDLSDPELRLTLEIGMRLHELKMSTGVDEAVRPPRR